MSEQLKPHHEDGKENNNDKEQEKGKVMNRREFLTHAVTTVAGTVASAMAPSTERRAFDSLLLSNIDPVRIDECGLAMKAVVHIPKTIDSESVRREIESAIADKNTPFIFVEGFWEDIAKMSSGDIPPTFSVNDKKVDGFGFFFANIAYLARKHGKDVVVVNPQPTTKLGERLSSEWRNTLAGAAAAGAVSASGLLSRRQFVRLLSATPLLAQMVDRQTHMYEDRKSADDMERQLKLWEEKGLIDQTLPRDEKIGYFLWNYMNWRDTGSALGTLKAMEMYRDEWRGKDVPAFYGSAHQGMLYYLKHSSKAELRYKTYLQYNLVDEPTVRRYHWTGKEWDQVDAEPYA